MKREEEFGREREEPILPRPDHAAIARLRARPQPRIKRQRMPGEGHVGAEGQINLIDIPRSDIIGDLQKSGIIIGAGKLRHRLSDPARKRIGKEARHICCRDFVIAIEHAEPEQRQRRIRPKRRDPAFERMARLIRDKTGHVPRLGTHCLQRGGYFAPLPRHNFLDRIAIQPRGRRACGTGIIKQDKRAIHQNHPRPSATKPPRVPVGIASFKAGPARPKPIKT